MKKMKRTIMLALGLILMSSVMYADDVKIDYSQLPPKARHFMEKHFGRVPDVKDVEQERAEYSVELRNGYEIDFDADGRLLEINSPDRKDLELKVIKDILPDKAVKHLQDENVINRVDDIKILRNGDFVVEIDTLVSEYNIHFNGKGDVVKTRK